jgi:hypothetical protein
MSMCDNTRNDNNYYNSNIQLVNTAIAEINHVAMKMRQTCAFMMNTDTMVGEVDVNTNSNVGIRDVSNSKNTMNLVGTEHNINLEITNETFNSESMLENNDTSINNINYDTLYTGIESIFIKNSSMAHTPSNNDVKNNNYDNNKISNHNNDKLVTPITIENDIAQTTLLPNTINTNDDINSKPNNDDSVSKKRNNWDRQHRVNKLLCYAANLNRLMENEVKLMVAARYN